MQRRVGQTLTEQFSQELDRGRLLIEAYMHDGLGIDDIRLKLSMVHGIKLTRAHVKAIVMRRA